MICRILKGRDPDYQKLAVKGLIGSSKRVLQGTKNEDKIRSIKEGVQILEDFLEEFDRENRSKSNLAYLPVAIVQAVGTPKNKLAAEFSETYADKAKGNYKHLRTIFPKGDDSKSWDIVRNSNLKVLKEKIDSKKAKLFNEDGSPTSEHLELIGWAYSPNADKLKAYVEKAKKRKSTDDSGKDNASSSKKKRSD